MARFEKDFRHLCRKIDSLSAGQARASRTNTFDRLNSSTLPDADNPSGSNQQFFIEISPRDGPYAQASYIFQIESSADNEYPDYQPIVSCITPIYHPNIDTTYNNLHNNVCLSTLSDWDGGPTSTFEDLLQGLMFLFHSPNCDDPLTSYVSTDPEEFVRNVRISIEGGDIEDFEGSPFETNYGYKRYLVEQQKKHDAEGESLDDHLVQLLIREPNYKHIFTPDTLEFLMDTPASSWTHTGRHKQDAITLN